MEAEIFSGSQRPDEMVAHPDESIVEFGARPPAPRDKLSQKEKEVK